MSYTRPPLERMMRIHHRLKKGDFPNCTTLAKEMEGLITRKAIGIAAFDENFLAPIRLALAKQVQLSTDS